MSTINQRVIDLNYQKPRKNKRPKFKGSPQRKGVVIRLRVCTPRKPNSARRPVAKVSLSTKKKALCHIPNTGHSLRRFSKTLVKGVGARDVPFVNYTCIHGWFDLQPLRNLKKRWSIYGTKKPLSMMTHNRRIFRNIFK